MKEKKIVSMEVFRGLFEEGVRRVIVKAQEFIEGDLPGKITFNMGGFSRPINFMDAEDVLSQLYHSGSFPRIIDLAICGIYDGHAVVWVRPSAHPLATKLEETWNQPQGSGPFKVAGLMLPSYLWEKGSPFSLLDLEQALY